MDQEPAKRPADAPDGLREETRERFVQGEFEAERVIRTAGSGAEVQAAFRARLRDEFVTGRLAQVAENRERLKSALEEPARPAFRSQLAARFVLGQLDDEAATEPTAIPRVAGTQGALVAGTQGAPGPQLDRAAPVHDFATARRRLVPTIVIGLLAAAAILFTTLPTLLGPQWSTRPDVDVTGVVFDQQAIDAGEPLPARTDRVLACGPEALRLSLEDRALVQLSPSSQIRFCAPMWTLFGSVRAPVHVDSGVLDVQTVQGEEHLDLVIEAPNAEVHFDAGAVSVKVNDRGTCVVVLEGTATLESSAGQGPITITAGHRAYVPRTGGAPLIDEEYVTAHPDADDRLGSLRTMLVDVEAGVF